MQAESTRYEPPAINFHLGETPPREPQRGREHTEWAACRSINNNSVGERNSYEPWSKLGVFVLVIAALGLPINDLVRYAVLVICAVGICCAQGRVTAFDNDTGDTFAGVKRNTDKRKTVIQNRRRSG